MDKRPLTKSERKQARAIVGEAWEAELAEALGDLEGLFGDWRKQRIDTHQLSDAIHKFHNGTNRELYVRYTHLPLEMAAARAIAYELVDPESVTPALRAALADLIEGDVPLSVEIRAGSGGVLRHYAASSFPSTPAPRASSAWRSSARSR